MKYLHVAALIALSPLSALAAGPDGVDGSIGAEWTGVTATSVFYNAAAPLGNFGTPTNANHVTGYDIYLRQDASYVYAALTTTGPTDSLGNLFANLYFSLRSGPGPVGNAGSSIGFEVTNDKAFKPGLPGYYADDSSGSSGKIQWATFAGLASDPDVIELAIDKSVFLSNSLGVASFGAASPVGIRLNLSQSFGYSVAGGSTYGDNQLGYLSLTPVPEPGSLALFAAGLGALGWVGRRRAAGRGR